MWRLSPFDWSEVNSGFPITAFHLQPIANTASGKSHFTSGVRSVDGSKLKSVGRAYLRFTRYGVGGLMTIIGVMMVAKGEPAFLRPFGVFFLIAGLLILPPIGRMMGERWPKLSPWYAAPLLAALSLLIGFATTVAGLVVWEKAHPEIVAKREADRKALASAATERKLAERQSQPPLKGLDREAMLVEARSALKNGQPERALTIVYDNAPPEMLTTDAEVKALIAEIEARIKASDATAGRSDFAEKVRAYWIPQVGGISQSPPASAPDVWNAIAKLEDATRALEDSKATSLDADGKDAQRNLRKAIAAKQRVLFPILRGAYGKIVGQAMWERDIDIRAGGAGNRSITWTGGIFAARANIARGQNEAQPHLVRLRFTHSTYEWVSGIGQRYTYTMDAPADDAVGYWEGGAFKPIG
jgi:hypothetical protein